MDLAPVLQSGVLGIVGRQAIFEPCDSGVVHDDVDASLLLEDPRCRELPAGLISNVQVKVCRVFSESGRGAAAELIVDVGNVDERPLCGECA